MKDYLIKFFNYNHQANLKILERMVRVDNKEELLYLFTHLILSQKKWFYRICEKDSSDIKWFDDTYDLAKCKTEWEVSFNNWITFLSCIDTDELYRRITYDASEGGCFSSTIMDIAIQLNFHSLHHRGHILNMMRKGGVTPPTTDYILYTRKEEKGSA